MTRALQTTRGAGARLFQVALRGPDSETIRALSAGQRAALMRLLSEVDEALERGHTLIEESPQMDSDGDRARRREGFDSAERLAQVAHDMAAQDAPGTLRLIARLRADEPMRAAYALRGDPGARQLSYARSADDERRVAQALVSRAAENQLKLLTGGPGTGKTFTIARLVMERMTAGASSGAPPRIHVMAPTGRAAARLREQLDAELRAATRGHATSSVALDTVSVSTIHAALGWRPTPGAPFTHTRSNPLPTDLAIIDECSMVDLALMRRVIEAVPASAMLVLVGDADQLASVEAGSVFSDCCSAPALSHALVRLTHNYRTAGDSRAAWLAHVVDAVRLGDAERVVFALQEQGVLVEPAAATAQSGSAKPRVVRLTELAADIAEPIYRDILESSLDDPLTAFDALRRFRILAATRSGDGGVESIADRLDERLLGGAGEFGRQVMILENDHDAELANGDMGVVVRDGVIVGRRGDGGPRALPRASLPAHESAWAISIHKSQGSEFDRVVVVLPDAASPILSRQLLYTALTRSRGQIQIVAREASVRAAVTQAIRRASGLADAISRCAG